MSIQFFSKLSHNYIEILEDNEYYDITIEVGKDPNIKIFRAHVIILCHRSSFLRRTLTSNKKNNDDLAHIKLSNISPETFQIILRYLYGGIFSLNGQDTLDIFKVLIAADELLLHELLYKNLLDSYMDPDVEPNDRNISLPRNLKLNDVIESNIVNLNITSTISRWIDKVDCNVKETGEILGGHNPTIWKSCNGNWGQSYCSFIFSFKNKDGIKDSILSRIRNIDKALCYFKNSGPSFGGSDLILSCNNGFGNEDLFDLNICKQTNYEKRIRDTEDKFYIEDYEVFQITKK
ncbi:BTB/POZ protein [Rhizophagus irregularis DAOM 181602=DAOM 197198]|nr:BTB/POZ protein [Rhizophagus irregularis DAOM 181602=DAOM 197198]